VTVTYSIKILMSGLRNIIAIAGITVSVQA